MNKKERKSRKMGAAGQLSAGVLTAVIGTLALLLIFACLGAKGAISESAFGAVSVGSCFIATALGGIVAGRLRGSGALKCGGVVAAALILVILCASLAAGDSPMPNFRAFTSMAAAAIGGISGGVIGTKKKKRRVRM